MDKKERCLSLCKDKNFKANHNTSTILSLSESDVCHYAKIRILKQITTSSLVNIMYAMMFVTMQR